jgi:hypothetical protein
MTTEDFISAWFSRVDAAMQDVPKPPLANLWPREVMTLGLLLALKGVGTRACYRGVDRDLPRLFPAVPERTRRFRRLALHRQGTEKFLANPAVLGVVESYGSEWRHPRREGRRAQQIGRKGNSTHRWSVGGKLGLLLTHLGVGVAWDGAGAQVPDTAVQPRMEAVEDERMVLRDEGFPAQEGTPPHLKLWRRGRWNTRMLVETVVSRLTGVCQLKTVLHRTGAAFQVRLAFTLAAFNLLVQWHGLRPDATGLIRLSLAEFSL